MSDKNTLHNRAILRIEELEAQLQEAEAYIEDLEKLALKLREQLELLASLKGWDNDA